MKRVLFFMPLLIALCWLPAIAGAEVCYVQSLKAKVMWEPSFKSTVMREVAKGEALKVLGREGNWVRVKIDFEIGYVSSLVVSKRPPMNRVALIKAEDQDLRQGVRRRASTYSSAAAARGLTQEGRKRIGRDEKTDYFDLEKIEALSISRDEVVKFIEGGSL